MRENLTYGLKRGSEFIEHVMRQLRYIWGNPETNLGRKLNSVYSLSTLPTDAETDQRVFQKE